MADEAKPDLFPELPEDLSALSNEELEDKRKEFVAAADMIDANDADFLGDRTAEDILAQYKAGNEGLKAIVQVQKEREEAQRNFDEERAKLSSERHEITATEEPEEASEEEAEETEASEDAPLEVVAEEPPAPPAPDDEGDDSGDGDEAKTEEKELVLAAVEPPKKKQVLRSVPASRPAAPVDGPKGALRASGGLGSVRAGEELDTQKLVAAMIEANGNTMAKSGYTEKVVVAHADIPYPSERQLDGRDAVANSEKIMAVMPDRLSPEALVASGGLCAPLTPLYDLPVLSVADRPVRDSLPSFQAARGGVSVPTAISMADVSGGVDIVTAAQDEAAGTDVYPKSCLDVTCDPFTDYEISMIYACVTHGNLGARSWPERVRAIAELQAAWHARLAEGNLLDGIANASTAVTVSATYGAVSSVINAILAAGDGLRSRHRLDPDTRLRWLAPDWARSLLVADLVNSQFGRFEVSVGGVRDLLSRIGRIDTVFYLDEEPGASQIFGAESGGALNAWPTSMVSYLYPEGSFIFLDQGTLDLGIVRDSVLNSTNDFQSFMETFEGIAFVGIESLKLTHTICPSGVVAAPASGISCPFFD